MNWSRVDSSVGELLLVAEGEALVDVGFPSAAPNFEPPPGAREGGRLLARVARQLAEYEMYYGDAAHWKSPAEVDADAVYAAIPEYKKIVAGEGRKFGIHLFLASQRPGKMHPNVLSQCDNLILMRMNGVGDLDELESTFSHVAPSLVREALSFGLGQALVAGPLAPLPVIVQVGSRLTPEGGADIPTTWTSLPGVE